MRACPQCGYENPEENGYCEQCHTLLPSGDLDADVVPPSFHPYVMWQGWPWAPNRTITQSKEEFAVSATVGAVAVAVAATALAFSVGVAFGAVLGAVTGIASGALGAAYLYFFWKAGRDLALGYAGANR